MPAINATPLTPLEVEHSMLQSLEPFQHFAHRPSSRSGAVLNVPHERQPAAPLSVRAVDSSIATFSALFRHQSAQLRERIVRHLISALKTASAETSGRRGSNAASQRGTGCLQHREVVVRNVCAAFLGAARELGAARPQSLSSSKWLDGAREFLCAALSSPDAVVRRGVCEALGDYARAADDTWVTALVERLKTAAEDKTKPPSVRSGSVVALASIFRRLESERCLTFLQDGTIYAVARETQQPIRTWVLHAWWLCVDAEELKHDRKYIKYTLALIEAHLLFESGTGSTPEYIVASVRLCVARLLNTLVRRLQPQLAAMESALGNQAEADAAFAEAQELLAAQGKSMPPPPPPSSGTSDKLVLKLLASWGELTYFMRDMCHASRVDVVSEVSISSWFVLQEALHLIIDLCASAPSFVHIHDWMPFLCHYVLDPSRGSDSESGGGVPLRGKARVGLQRVAIRCVVAICKLPKHPGLAKQYDVPLLLFRVMEAGESSFFFP